MIKLAASDLDGTLLDSSGRLPSEIFPLIEELYEKGITFCAASGRQLVSLEKLFAPVRDKIIFIAENGALCAWRGEIFFSCFSSVIPNSRKVTGSPASRIKPERVSIPARASSSSLFPSLGISHTCSANLANLDWPSR